MTMLAEHINCEAHEAGLGLAEPTGPDGRLYPVPISSGEISSGGRIRKAIFGLSPDETKFRKRGFICDSESIRLHLERVGAAFAFGYNAALASDDTENLCRILENEALFFRGFAYEGAAMACAILDGVRVWGGQHWNELLEASGHAHLYMLYVGKGWAWARLPFSVMKAIERSDPLYRWLAVDGYGFHEGYFNWQKYVVRQERPKNLSGYALKAFDQGLGRSLWFSQGAMPTRVAISMSRFPEGRRNDLWAGVGLACGYAGGVDDNTICELIRLSDAYLKALSQGAAFAAEARMRAKNLATWSPRLIELLCGRPLMDVVGIVRHTRQHLSKDEFPCAYEQWRSALQGRFSPTRPPS